jgi:hypothetical protein
MLNLASEIIDFTPPLVIMFYVFVIFSYVAAGTRTKTNIKIGTIALLFVFIAVALLQTYAQYSVWHNDPVSKSFLPPTTPITYFLQYSFTHFWFSRLISIAFSLLFYLFLRLLAKRRPWLFLDGETELGFVCALIAGWPGFVVFLPLVFIAALPWTIFRQYVLKQERTTLGPAFLLAAGVVLLAGGWLIARLGLGVLRI